MTVTAFQFLAPERLWLLIGVGALGAAYVSSQVRSGRYVVRFTNLALLDSVAPDRPGWRRHVPALLLLLALTGMVGALAEPAAARRVPRERATIIVAIDTSLSMQATDVAPSRIEAAQDAANEFVDLLPERLNVGLVTFNGIAKVAVPPTQNREELHAAIDQIRLGERTAIGEAIYASLDAIGVAPGATSLLPDGTTATDDADDADDESGGGDDEVPARIVLMSDGSTTVGRPDAQAAAAAAAADVPVSTIAFGTPRGIIEIEGQPGPISVAVNPEALSQIAVDTGGTAFSAATGDELQKVYEDIGSSIGYTTEERDITAWFVGASLGLLFGAAVLSLLWFSRLP